MKKIFYILLLLFPYITFAQSTYKLYGPIQQQYIGDTTKLYHSGTNSTFWTSLGLFDFLKPIRSTAFFQGTDTLMTKAEGRALISTETDPIWTSAQPYYVTRVELGDTALQLRTDLAGGGGITPTDGILHWNSGTNVYEPYEYGIPPYDSPGSFGNKFVQSFNEFELPDTFRYNKLFFGGELMTSNLTFSYLKLYNSTGGVNFSKIYVDSTGSGSHNIHLQTAGSFGQVIANGDIVTENRFIINYYGTPTGTISGATGSIGMNASGGIASINGHDAYINSENTIKLRINYNDIAYVDSLGFHATKYFVSSLNTAPSSATDTGTTGEIRICSDYIYVCIATDTWVRTALTTW